MADGLENAAAALEALKASGQMPAAPRALVPPCVHAIPAPDLGCGRIRCAHENNLPLHQAQCAPHKCKFYQQAGERAAPPTPEAQRRLLLRCWQSPGDVLMLTAAVRDLHLAHPNRFLTDLKTSADQLWENNPYVTKLDPQIAPVEEVNCEYPLVHKSNQLPYHFLHGHRKFLEERLEVRIPPTAFKGDIHLSEKERSWMSQVEEAGHKGPFWIIVSGGKRDFTAKWWNPFYAQSVVDRLKDRVFFVQCGQADHWHLPLNGVLDLRGKTDTRQFVRLIYHASGVVCPVTFAMHLAAAVPTKDGRLRPCVVLAGGREPVHWEEYPGHQFLHTIGALPCCRQGGCWKSRCQKIGDGDRKDREALCEQPCQVLPDLRIPLCMQMITPERVCQSIEMYLEGASAA